MAAAKPRQWPIADENEKFTVYRYQAPPDSGSARQIARSESASSPGGLISVLAGGDLDRVDAKIVVEAARQGDADASAILENLAKRLAQGISAVQCILDPGIIILGGEVSHAGPLLLEHLKAQVLKMTRPPVGKIVVSSSLSIHSFV